VPRESKTIVLPWKKPLLNLNTRQHWAAKARDTETVRSVTAMLCRDLDQAPKVRVQLSYTPRDKRRRDADNLVGMLKAICDGIVDAGVVPDDTPEFMVKEMPEIRPPEGKSARMELLVEALDE
jgi:crossover junction endodeoxyribonuclease RusA